MQKIGKLLKKTEFFSEFSDFELQKVAEYAKILDYSAKNPIFSAGERAKGFFLVLDGAIKVYQLSPDGDENLLNIFGKNDLVALAAALKNGSYPAFAETIEPSRLVYIPIRPFLEILDSRKGLAIKVIYGLSKLLHQFVQRLNDLALKEAPARLAGYLLKESGGRSRFTLSVKKGTLALQLNIKQETLSRAFARLVGKRLISVKGGEIEIKDISGLEDLT